MAIDTGGKVQIAWGAETTPGTPVAPVRTLAHESATFKRNLTKTQVQSVLGTKSADIVSKVVRDFGMGSLNGYVTSALLGDFLTLMAGQSPTTTDASGGGKSHAFTNAETFEGKAYTIYRKTSNYNERFAGARLGRTSINLVEDSLAMYETEAISRKTETNSTGFPTIASPKNFFAPSGLTLKQAAAVGDIASATSIKAKSVRLMWEPTGFRGYPSVSESGFSVVGWDRYRIMIEVVALLNSDDIRGFWVADTNRYVQLEATSEGSEVDGSDTYSPKLTFDLPNAQVMPWDDSQPKDGFVEQTFTFVGNYDATTTASWKATLVNEIDSY